MIFSLLIAVTGGENANVTVILIYYVQLSSLLRFVHCSAFKVIHLLFKLDTIL